MVIHRIHNKLILQIFLVYLEYSTISTDVLLSELVVCCLDLEMNIRIVNIFQLKKPEYYKILSQTVAK